MLTTGAGQLTVCGIPATFPLWLCRAATGSIQVGRLTAVLLLNGKTWIARLCDEGIRTS